MRQVVYSASLAAFVLACPVVATGQEADGLRQTVIIDDPFQDARVPVRPSAFAPQRPTDEAIRRSAETEPTLDEETIRRTETQSARSVFDRGADLDAPEDSVLAFSGYDSINREADERSRLSLLAATGQLPALEVDPLPRTIQPQVDAYAATGIRRGSFILFPELEVGGVYSSNVASLSPDGPDDFGLRVAPRVALRSDWSRHALAFEAQSESVYWDEFNTQNINNASAAVSGRVDIRSTTTLDLSAGVGLSQSTTADIEVPDSASSPREDMAYNMLARLTHSMGRVVTQATAAVTWFRFGDVDLGALGIEDNDDRDYVTPSVGFRVGYLMTPAVQPFVEVTYAPRIHDQNVDRNGLRRDSQGVVLRSGVAFNDASIWAGEVAARYEIRDYEDAALRTQSALGVDANISWSPSALTTVALTAASQIEESSDPLVSGATTWSASVQVLHQLMDNVALEAGLSLGHTDYDGISDETLFGSSLGAAYAIHKEIELIAGYEFSTQKPDAGDSTTEHRLSSGVRFKL